MLAQNNVVKMPSNIVYEQIQKYLTKLGYDSERTQADYHADIKMYFKIMKGKELEFLTPQDVQLTLDDFEDYIAKLYSLTKEDGSKHYANKTINRRITSIKGLLRYLASKKIHGEYLVKDIAYLSLITSLPEEKNHYEVLTGDQVMELVKLALEEREKPLIKSLLLEFAYDTGIRKSSILSIKWSDIIKRGDEYEINGVDKGNKSYKKYICESLYNDLQHIRTDSEYVFDISVQAVDDMFRRIKKKSVTIPEEIKNKAVFHSVRKAAGTFVHNSYKDLNMTRDFLNHSSANTTTIYVGIDNKVGAIGAISSMRTTRLDLYNKVDLDTLVEAISMMDKTYQVVLNKKIEELQKLKGK